MDTIKLYSRYGNEYSLKHIGESQYAFEGNSEYMRVGHNEDGTINFIDPEGGPFMRVGSTIEDKVIKDIYFDKNVCKWVIKLT
jgi:hypothetical protein